MVNAPVVAKERNIKVSEVRHEDEGDYHTLIRVVVTTEQQSRAVAGTLFADRQPRIVQVKGINIEAEICKHMLYITNDDKPGFIGALGTVLGDEKLNIATFHLGRSNEGDGAIALIAVDQPVSQNILAKVRGLPSVRQAKVLNF